MSFPSRSMESSVRFFCSATAISRAPHDVIPLRARPKTSSELFTMSASESAWIPSLEPCAITPDPLISSLFSVLVSFSSSASTLVPAGPSGLRLRSRSHSTMLRLSASERDDAPATLMPLEARPSLSSERLCNRLRARSAAPSSCIKLWPRSSAVREVWPSNPAPMASAPSSPRSLSVKFRLAIEVLPARMPLAMARAPSKPIPLLRQLSDVRGPFGRSASRAPKAVAPSLLMWALVTSTVSTKGLLRRQSFSSHTPSSPSCRCGRLTCVMGGAERSNSYSLEHGTTTTQLRRSTPSPCAGLRSSTLYFPSAMKR
mmetsp:Transcript_33239/g.76861  ORF Transcript_33239/g.76861 Transcript_33239/m.76861 type:complete len:315 (-) Transcript_33239:636-1580(-)